MTRRPQLELVAAVVVCCAGQGLVLAGILGALPVQPGDHLERLKGNRAGHDDLGADNPAAPSPSPARSSGRQ